MLAIALLVGTICASLPCQVLGTGKTYAITCGSLYAEDMSGTCTIIMHTNVTTTATISTPLGDIQLDLVPGEASAYELDGAYSVTEGIETKTVYVSSEVDIEVHISNEGILSPYDVLDTVEAQPISEVDVEHYIINYGDGFNDCPGYTAFYTVAALEDATNVFIYTRGVDGTLELLEEFVLQRFESYSDRTYTSGVEPNFSGYVVRSSAPTVTYSGNRCALEDGFYHSTWSSVPSLAYLGTSHVTYPLATSVDSAEGSYGIKVVATEDNTLVTTSILGQSIGLDAAEVAYAWYSEEHIGVVQCTKPCVVLQMVRGTAEECGVTQTVIMPTERMTNYGKFSTPPQMNSVTSYLHIIHSSPTGEGMFFDGNSLDGEDWQPHGTGYSYLSFQIDDGIHEVWSNTQFFSAAVSGVGSNERGYMFNVNTGVGTIEPPDNAPRPQKRIPLDGAFESSSGEDFTFDCADQYDAALRENVEETAATVNSMIGGALCNASDLADMRVITYSSTFTPANNTGTNRISYYLLVGLDQTESEAEACASEISDWLIPHDNWAQIVPSIPDCPEIVFTEDQWSHTDNDWVCFADDVPTTKSEVYVTALSYDLTMEARFGTDTGEDLSPYCTQIYTQDLLVSTLNQRSMVNDMLGSDLCNGLDIQLGVPTVRLNPIGSLGETHQDYPFILSGLSDDTQLRAVSDCASEVSAYLAPHANWQQPIIPTDPACPGIIFNPEEFLEEAQQWVCVEQ